MSRRCKATSGRSKAAARADTHRPSQRTDGAGPHGLCAERKGRGDLIRSRKRLHESRTESKGRGDRARNERKAAEITRGTEGSRKPCSKRKKGRRNHAPNRRAAETARGAERSRTDRTEGAARGLKKPENARKGPAGGAPREVRRGRCAAQKNSGRGVSHDTSRPELSQRNPGKEIPDYCCAPDSASCVSF